MELCIATVVFFSQADKQSCTTFLGAPCKVPMDIKPERHVFYGALQGAVRSLGALQGAQNAAGFFHSTASLCIRNPCNKTWKVEETLQPAMHTLNYTMQKDTNQHFSGHRGSPCLQ